MNTIPKKMRGVYLTGNGGFEKLEYRTDIDVPTPKAGEVLVKIGGAAVNNTDVNTRIGWYSKSELDVRDLYLKDLSLFGSTYQTKEAFQNLIRYIEEGKIKPAIAKEFPLKDIVEAQKAFLSKTLAGKFVIDVTAK
ncbi:zinc-binding dehydrogenase [Oceanobacillus oncorhynchi]|uniref:zinc-binding dehydrogenase n=1 Tax=Oceanobacillus oncorhynchi TaxID=545501 RepID=UPI0018677679|nr:zinc-binding dehydrogenase [Oceanobacillus oncorhynchi]